MVVQRYAVMEEPDGEPASPCHWHDDALAARRAMIAEVCEVAAATGGQAEYDDTADCAMIAYDDGHDTCYWIKRTVEV